ncbi:MAG TPA: DUF2892 domain-containing protein [Candidatus Angelobacter sp.]|nr:DUF2892 domain-containing protein [Candidatus Angelobacter sp.]
MSVNESTLDRVLRAVAGIAAAVAAFAVGFGAALGIVLAVLAVVLLGTSATGFCPLYRLLGISTNSSAGRSVVPR